MVMGMGMGVGFSSPPPWTPAAVPAGFAAVWTPTFAVERKGSQFRTTVDYAALIPATVKTRYVDLATGSDSTKDGTSWAQAWKTVQKAIDMAAADADICRVYIKAGHYAFGNGMNNTNVAHDLALIADGGTVVISAAYPGLSWALTGGQTVTYQTTRSAAGLVDDLTQLDAEGHPSRLILASSIATVEATAGSYWIDGNIVYVHTWDNRAPDANVEVHLAVNGPTMNSATAHYYFQGIEFRSAGNSSLIITTAARVTCVDCRFTMSRGNGLSVNGTAEVFVKNCLAYWNVADGFNYHTSAKVLEDGCTSARNGKGDSDNATTIHDANNCIIRVNGDYSYGTGPVLADISAGVTWCLGCHVHHALATPGTWQNVAFYSEQAGMWLDTCTTDNCDRGCYEGGAGTVYQYNSTLGPTFGDVQAYTP
jgi:hypothetical protein